jgi:hypothetical protein
VKYVDVKKMRFVSPNFFKYQVTKPWNFANTDLISPAKKNPGAWETQQSQKLENDQPEVSNAKFTYVDVKESFEKSIQYSNPKLWNTIKSENCFKGIT